VLARVNFRGFVKTTLLDYPGKLASVFFVAKCNFRCPFCHNRDLVLSSSSLPIISVDEAISFLKKRKKILEGVCISGGEPTLYSGLSSFLRKCKKLGYLVKIDTNGANPDFLKQLIDKKLVDYVALDYKGKFGAYGKYIGKKEGKEIELGVIETIKLLIKSKIEFELRTTVVPTLHTKKDLIKMAEDLVKIVGKGRKRIRCFWQQFRPVNCLDLSFNKLEPYPKSWFEDVLGKIKYGFLEIRLRG